MAAEALREVVEDPPDPYLGAECLLSLAAIEGEGARPLLDQYADSGGLLMERAARQALASLARRQ